MAANLLWRIAIVVQGRSSALKKLKADFPFTWKGNYEDKNYKVKVKVLKLLPFHLQH